MFLVFNFFVCQNDKEEFSYLTSMGRIMKLSTTVLRARINKLIINKISTLEALNNIKFFCFLLSTQINNECFTCMETLGNSFSRSTSVEDHF